jgi:hypothetical protein
VEDFVLLNEVWIFLGCIVLALAAAWVTVRETSPDTPVWPVRFYLWFFRVSNVPWFRRYPESRITFSVREQFLTSFFIWFFIFFIVAISALECDRRGTCW